MRAASPATEPAVKLTYDDFLLFPDDGKQHELIDRRSSRGEQPPFERVVVLPGR